VNFTDASGYCFMGCFWQPIFRAVQNFLRQVPIVGAIVQIAAGALCTTVLAPVCVGIAAAVITGITNGKLGLALRAGFIAAATAYAFAAVGDVTGTFSGAPNGRHAPLDFMSEAHQFNIAGITQRRRHSFYPSDAWPFQIGDDGDLHARCDL